MMGRLIVLFLLSLLLISCGVDTSSSDSIEVSNIVDDSTNPINPNPIDSIDSGSTDSGSTDSGSTDSNCEETSFYECSDAVYDLNACTALSYNTASDASYNGTDSSENGSDFFNIGDEGLAIKSEHLEGSSENLSKTWVTLYYKSFPVSSSLGLQGYTGYVMDGYFYVTYDIAWSDTSISGIDRTLYVKTNQDEKPVCRRLILNSVDGASIDVQKVYR